MEKGAEGLALPCPELLETTGYELDTSYSRRPQQPKTLSSVEDLSVTLVEGQSIRSRAHGQGLLGGITPQSGLITEVG